MNFIQNEGLATIAVEQIKILGAFLEPIHPIWPIFGVNCLDWNCCLASNSNMAPRYFDLIAIDDNYSYEVWVPAFFKHNNSFIATV